MFVNAHKKEIEIRSADQGKGEFSATIHADMQGENVEVLFNYKYLLDGLSNMQEEDIVFELNGSAAPCDDKIKERRVSIRSNADKM